MNYQRIHDTIIARAKNRTLEGYSERHHIIPQCMGGTNGKENIIRLTPEEHYVVHQLLVKIYPNEPKLVYAVHRLSYMSKFHTYNTNKSFGWVRRKMAMGMAITNKGRSPWNKGKRVSIESNIKRSITLTGHKLSPETIAKRTATRHKNGLNPYSKRT